MAVQPYRDDELNYFKFTSIVLNEFPKALRHAFKTMWDNNIGHRPGFQLWDDSPAVGKLFVSTEGGRTKVPTRKSYNEWDCTALFQATIYAQTFALHHRTLSDLYVKPRSVPHGSFHTSVVSPGGNSAETFALAIDQLRLLRNSVCHSTGSQMDKVTFDQCVQHARDAFSALGLKTDPIDVIGSLTESDFPTNEVRKLEQGIKAETRAYIKFLESVSSDIDELKALSTALKNDTANKKDIAMLEEKLSSDIDELRSSSATIEQKVEGMLERKISELKKAQQESDVETNASVFTSENGGDIQVRAQGSQPNTDTKPLLPRCCLPPVVPNFTGRQRECEEIIAHVTSESTRMLSIWGSPGFGKTSVAITVGHDLHSQGLLVYFISLQGLQSKADLTSKLLSLFRQPASNDQPYVQRLSLDDELCQIFTDISDRCVFILDNADDALESGLPKVKEEVMHLLEEILRRNEKVTFVVTTRESFEFMNLHFQGHQSVRIRPLDEASSQSLVHKLLLSANTSDCVRITQICGHVPLAVKLLCSLMSEDGTQPTQFLHDFMVSSTESIPEMLDNPGYPTNHRLQFLFDSSFQRLSIKEKEALVSLCILPETFNIEVAAAVLGEARIFEVRKILQSLRRKSLLDSSSQPMSFLMHTLLQSFAREKGEHQMKETVLNAKSRLCAFYVSLFEKLNEQFLTGHSMSAFIAFYDDKKNIVQSLIEGCSDSKIADSVFEVLVKGELFLDNLFFNYTEGYVFYKIYDSAVKAAKKLEKNEYHCQLLVSKAFGEVYYGAEKSTMHLLCKAREIHESARQSPSSTFNAGKSICYSGICHLVAGNIEDGAQCIQEALLLMNNSPEQTILKLVIFQILALYYQYQHDSSSSVVSYNKALQQCRAAGDTGLLVIPPLKSKEKKAGYEKKPQRDKDVLLNQPLKLEMIFLLSQAAKNLSDTDVKQYFSNTALQILKGIDTEVPISLGVFTFYRNAAVLLTSFNQVEDPVKLYEARISYHQTALRQCSDNKGSSCRREENSATFYHEHNEALAKCFLDLGRFYHSKGNYLEALQSYQRALDITFELFGEEHASTADCYQSIGLTQRKIGDFRLALQSHQRALDGRRKLFGEEHASTGDSYYSLGVTQQSLGDFSSALQPHQCALNVPLKLFGEEHPRTADSYRQLGATQHKLGDFTSALRSHQRALNIRLKLFGREHPSTVDSYCQIWAAERKLKSLSQVSEHTYKTSI